MRRRGFLTVAAAIIFASLIMAGCVNGQSYEEEDGTAEVLFMVIALIFVTLLQLSIPLALAIFVKLNADSNGVDNGWLWAILTFFFGPIMFFVYFFVIRPRGSASHKPMKKTDMSKYMNVRVTPGFCPHCGFNAGRTSGKCPKCRTDLS